MKKIVPVVLIMVLGMIASTASAQESRPVGVGKTEQRLYRLSVGALWAGETVDLIGTYKGLHHPSWVCGDAPGTISVPGLIPECNASPTGLYANYAVNTTATWGTFTEDGWAKFVGKRNFPGVAAMNIGLDFGQMMLGRYLYHKGGWRAKTAIALNFLHGGFHLGAGIQDIRLVDGFNPMPAIQAQNSGGPTWWGNQ